MKLSARNVLKGTIESIQEGAVNGIVAIKVGNEVVKAGITMDAIEGLGLKVGGEAYAVIKASNVMFAAGSERIANLSARNQIAGKVIEVKEGAVNGHVAIDANGTVIKGSITNEAIENLGLKVGADAVAIIKSTDVMVAVD
jgi:molybdate transport system regulatory protein